MSEKLNLLSTGLKCGAISTGLLLSACQTISPDKTKTNLKYSISEFSKVSEDRALVAISNNSMHMKLAKADVENEKFGTKYRVTTAIHEIQIKKFKFNDGVKNGFKIGHLPAGNYVHVGSENIRPGFNKNSYTQIVNCNNAGAAVMTLEAGKFYLLRVNDARPPTNRDKSTSTFSKSEAKQYLETLVQRETGETVTFETPKTIGTAKFEGGKKGPMLGFVGQGSIACPDGKSFNYTPL